MDPYASEVSQGATTAVLGGAAVAYGLHSGNTWLVLGGAVVAMFGIARWQRNAQLANPRRAGRMVPAGSVVDLATGAVKPAPDTLTGVS